MQTAAQPHLIALAAHIAGVVLVAAVFAFLYQQTRRIYFSYWALAWTLLSVALLFRLAALVSRQNVFLMPYGLLEVAFATSLVFARASVAGRFDIRLPAATWLVAAFFLAGYGAAFRAHFRGFHSLHHMLLAAIYGWNSLISWRRGRPAAGAGPKLFSFALLASAALNFIYGLSYPLADWNPVDLPPPVYLRFHNLPDLLLQTLLAFSAMMMWLETQNQELAELNRELAVSRQEIARHSRLDPLTGLLNRAALDQTCEAGEAVSGVVAVLDLDNFKDVNDVLGHLTGDEVLANVGNLIRTSVRRQDLAWRWGGDEFVVLFRDSNREAVEERLRTLEQRLLRFRMRGKGVLPINISWGLAEIQDRTLRQALEEADQQMYLRKRERSPISKFFGKE